MAELVKLTATATFECENSCGEIIEKGRHSWFNRETKKNICLSCAKIVVGYV